MAKVKITGHASGTGVVTVTAPNTSTDRTITLPDATDTLIGSATTDALTTRINGAGGRKNMIINGAMNVAQRGTSTTGITAAGYNTVDRFKSTLGTAGTWTQSQSTDVPTGQGFATSLKMDCTTANASLSAGSYLFIEQGLEGQDLQHLKKGTASAESVTLSFWVKSNKTGTYICELMDGDNSRTISKSYTIDSSNTWEKKTITYSGDTTGAFGNDNGKSLRVNFHLVAGTTFSSGTLATSWESQTNANRAVGQVNLADSTSNDWYVTGVQLELGSTATDFEHRSYGEELALCQRYYCKSFLIGTTPSNDTSEDSSGWGGLTAYTSSTTRPSPIYYASRMRVAPTIVFYNGSTSEADGLWGYYTGSNWVDSTATSLSKATEIHFYPSIQGSYTANYSYLGRGHWTADAEL